MSWRDLDIGAVSAYAIAVEHGYKGTEEEWARDQAAAGTNAGIARKAAENAKASENAAKDALNSIVPEKDSALAAIKAKGDEQVAAVQSEGEAQVQDVRDAGAEQSEALAAQGDVEQRKVVAAGDEQVARVTQTAQGTVDAVKTAEAESIAAVQESASAAGAEQEQKIAQKGADTLASIPDDYSMLVGEVNQLSEEMADFLDVPFEWISGGFINAVHGSAVNNANYKRTDYIPLNRNGVSVPIAYRVKVPINVGIAIYDENKVFVRGITTDTEEATELDGVVVANSGESFMRASTLAAYDATLRYTNVGGASVSLPDGCVTTDTLADGAVTSDKLVDGAVTTDKLANYVHNPATNYIDLTRCEPGYIMTTGAVKPDTSLYATNPIPMQSGDKFFWFALYTGYYAFYAADGSVIEAHGSDASLVNPIVIPDGTAYARFTFHKSNYDNVWMHTSNTKPDAYGKHLDLSGVKIHTNGIPTEYTGDDICAFTRCLCIGDSLTAGTMNWRDETGSTGNYVDRAQYAFPANLARMTGLEVVNMGMGGKSSAEWYAAKQATDLSGYDIAIIQLGVNDSIRYGAWTQTSIDGFTNIINKLKTENVGIKIFVSTIIPATSYMNEAIDAVSQGIREFVAGLNDADVIMLDMAAYGHTADSAAYNCGHLSAYGYWRLAADYKAYIGWHMNANKAAYREIQFIGTDYSFS